MRRPQPPQTSPPEVPRTAKGPTMCRVFCIAQGTEDTLRDSLRVQEFRNSMVKDCVGRGKEAARLAWEKGNAGELLVGESGLASDAEPSALELDPGMGEAAALRRVFSSGGSFSAVYARDHDGICIGVSD